MSIKSISKPFIIVATSTALAGGFGGYIWIEEHRPPVLEVYVFAMNSGRSMFIRTPDDKRILVDGGSNSGIIRELSKIIPFYSRRIDYVIATNTENKNVTGLVDVIERYKVEKVFVPETTLENLGLASSSIGAYSTFVDMVSVNGIAKEEVSAGRSIVLDDEVYLDIIFPTKDPKFTYSKASAPEILFTLKYKNNSLIFLGNASAKIQKVLAGNNSQNLAPTSNQSSRSGFSNVDVLIVSHSALPANISPLLIEKINPKNLVYSKKVQTTKAMKDTEEYNVTGTTTSKTKKKEPVDALKYLKDQDRFNLKEKGTIKIVGDGKSVTIVTEDK
jgi:beta-lactamase superfamily II metal-dependent hydrolase